MMKLFLGIVAISLFYVKHAIATTNTADPPNGAPNHNPEEPNPHRYIVRTGDETVGIMSGNTVMSVVNGIVIPLPGVTHAMVVEFESEVDAYEFRRANEDSAVEIEQDHARYFSYVDKSLDQRVRKLAQNIPWGINKIFEDADGNPDVPGPSYFPVATSHPVCIIDSGIELSHPDLPNDVSNADPRQGSSFSTDSCGHGTHVAGTIIANDNNEGVIGVYPSAPGVKIVKVFGGSSCNWIYSSTLMQAVDNCVYSGAKIISMSLGGGGPTLTEQRLYDTLYNDRDILIIAAAGNDGNSQYGYPASYPSVISVGATDVNDEIASFSQYNNQVDISAPGVNVISTEYSNRYTVKSGTSMATPHVSGIVLLLWSRHPSCTNTDIRNAIESGAKDLGTPGRDNFFGSGLANYWSADSYIMGQACANSSATSAPTLSPTSTPTLAPITKAPTDFPTTTTSTLTISPTTTQTSPPTRVSLRPTMSPTSPQTNAPTDEPTAITNAPTDFPTATTSAPTVSPTTTPISAPVRASLRPTVSPTSLCLSEGSTCRYFSDTCDQCCNADATCPWYWFGFCECN